MDSEEWLDNAFKEEHFLHLLSEGRSDRLSLETKREMVTLSILPLIVHTWSESGRLYAVKGFWEAFEQKTLRTDTLPWMPF